MTSSAFETATLNPVTCLDRLAVSDLGRSYKRRMLDELELRAGHRVVGLGCGPGTDLDVLAQAVAPTGAVIGIDHDQAMVDARAGTYHWSGSGGCPTRGHPRPAVARPHRRPSEHGQGPRG